MKITESKLRKIIKSIIAENQAPSISNSEMEAVKGIVAAIQQYQNETVQENSEKTFAYSIADAGLRLFSLKATIPMIASAIIIYCNMNGIEVDALTMAEAGKIVSAIGLKGNHALEIIMNVIAGIGGTYGVVKGAKALDSSD